MSRILIIDDEEAIRETLAWIFELEKHTVVTAKSGQEGFKIIQNEEVDCILLDVKMEGWDGLETLKHIRDIQSEIPVIMISGHGNIETAVEATKLGAFDFVEKPPDRERLLLLVRNALEKKHLETENKHLETQVRTLSHQLVGTGQMLGNSAAMRSIRQMIERVAPTDARVLITGENGSGKELVARAIHKNSGRRDKPFIEVNCAAIPKDLIESELFGHEKGSFTGALGQRIGKFEQADGGTLFMDEIGDMSLEAQAKVLKVIDEGWIERVGSSTGKPIKVDVRVLAATNKNLPEEIRVGHFREDLYHRLNVIPIHVPPLRQRREDIAILVRAFAEEFAGVSKRKPIKFDDQAMALMMALPYSGNIRELRNIIERIVILTHSDVVQKDDVERLGVAFSMMTQQPTPQVTTSGSDDLAKSVILTPTDIARMQAAETDAYFAAQANSPLQEALNAGTFRDFKELAEKIYITERLREYNWNVSRTAKALDIQRSHLYTKMRSYGLMKEGEEVIEEDAE